MTGEEVFITRCSSCAYERLTRVKIDECDKCGGGLEVIAEGNFHNSMEKGKGDAE